MVFVSVEGSVGFVVVVSDRRDVQGFERTSQEIKKASDSRWLP